MYTTYDIFNDLLDLRGTIDRFFRETPSVSRRFDVPYINLYDQGDVLEIRALVPGLAPEDLNIQLIDNTVRIEGEKKSDYLDKPYIRKERAFGSFKKAVKLPFRVDPNSIQAAMKNGVLTVRLAKSEDAKPRRIEIQ